MKTKTILITLIAMLAVTALVFQSCKKENEQSAPNGNDTSPIPKTTKVIAEDDWSTLISDVDLTTFTFTFNNNPGLEVGDVLVTTADGGYLRKVTEISTNNGKVEVKTEFASLTDAIEKGHGEIKDTRLIPNMESDSLWMDEGVSILNKKDGENMSVGLDLNLILYDADGNPQTDNDQVKIEGDFEMESDFSIDIDINDFNLDYLKLGYDFTETTGINATFTGGLKFTKQKKIATIPCGKIIVPAGIPIYIEPYIDFYAGFEVSSETALQTGVSQIYEYNATLTYDNGDWTNEKQLKKTLVPYAPIITGELEAKTYIKPYLRFKIYRTVSPYVNGEIYAKAETEMSNNLINWGLYLGFGAHAGAYMKIFKRNLFNYDLKLFEMEWELLNGQLGGSNTPPIAIFDVDPVSGNTSTNFAFDASGSTDNEDPTSNLQVRWDFDGNGSWDTGWDYDKTTNHQYSSEGTYTAKIEVKDPEGLTDEYTKSITVSNGGGGNTPPTALFTVSPSSGTTSTNFAFDASGCTDNEDPTSNLQVRWDFDGNGSWDTGWDYDKTANHQYSSEGSYTAKLEVKDPEGLTDEYAKSITVSNGGGTTGTFTDPRDGQTYQTIEIGSQTWFAENLNYETSNSWWYNNSSANGDIYGRLYTWDAALNACPTGWHLPSDDEWKTLEIELGISSSEINSTGYRGTNQGTQLKVNGSSGFDALLAGYRSGVFSSFSEITNKGFYWTNSSVSQSNVWYREFSLYETRVGRFQTLKNNGLSIRCLKN